MFSIFIIAQEKYKIQLYDLNYRINNGVKNNTSSNISITIKYEDGTQKILYKRDINNNGDQEISWKTNSFISFTKPISIECYAFVNFRTGTDANGTKKINLTNNTSEQQFNESYSPRMTNIKFKYRVEPILEINNMSSDTICAGETINLSSTHANYPNTTYQWEYSLDNLNWSFLPNTIDTNPILNTNNTSNIIFSISNIVEDHKSLFNKKIFFRLGYQGMSYSKPFLSIIYSPCAPIIRSVYYVGPNCYNESIQKLEVTFNRPLDSTKGENLNQLYVKETVNNIPPIKETPMLYLENISYPSSTKIYAYSNIASLGSLESGREYEIAYQAQIIDPLDSSKKILKGTMSSTAKFTHFNPVPLKFKLQNPKNPSCFGAEDGSVEILITSGIPKNFELNGKPYTPVKIDNTLYRIDGLGANELGHKIKVTDTNNCIDTNAND